MSSASAVASPSGSPAPPSSLAPSSPAPSSTASSPPPPPKTPPKPSPPKPLPRTPATRLRSSAATSTAGKILNAHLYNLNAQDMEGKWVGPVPIEKWLLDFAPKKAGRTRTPKKKINGFKDIKTTTKGEATFVDAITKSGILDGHGLWCKDTSKIFGRDETTDADHKLKFSPDVAVLGTNGLILKANNEERLERLLGAIQAFGDLKSKNSQDPCLRITSDAERELLGVLREDIDGDSDSFFTRGQFVCYARAICANSHRTHLYGFVVLPEYARLFYFDRSGVAYSSLFNWRETQHLADFLQSFAVASPLERGIDPSVTKISTKDKLVTDALTIFERSAKAADVLPDDITWDSVFKSAQSKDATYWLCNVYDEVAKSFHRVLTYRVHTSSPYFGGRATRGYIGVDIDQGVVAYMKRSWRIAEDAFPKERDVYREFDRADENGKKVPHLPGCYFGGDVPRESESLAADYFKWKKTAKPGDSWSPPSSITPIVTRTAHYADENRNVPDIRRGVSNRTDLKDENVEMLPYILTVTLFNRIGSRLREFKSTRDLCVAIRDALETHQAAFNLKNVLHRDISDGNILIAKIPGKPGEVEGLLIDWDLSVDVKKYTTARRKSRTGTWAFMSARMLEQPKGFVHDVFDDLESVCHVLHWHIYRFRHTTAIGNKSQLWNVMGQLFNPDERSMDATAGAEVKRGFFQGSSQVVIRARTAVKPTPLRDIMAEICKPFKNYYAVRPEQPTARELSDPVATEEYEADIAQYERAIAKGYRMCTHEYMLASFNAALNSGTSWVNDSAALDQYPPHIRKAQAEGKAIEDFYKETNSGVIISGPSVVAKAPSKRLFSQTELDFDPRYYSTGSGRGSSYYTDVTDTSNNSMDGERKKQRMDQ